MLCKCVVLSLPADSEESEPQLSSFSPPLPRSSLDLQLSPHRSIPRCGSLTVPCYLTSVRVQEAGEGGEASADVHIWKYVQSLSRMGFLFLFSM